MIWSQEQINFLTENYPKKGKFWCVTEMNLTEPQIRSKAARLKLKARGTSEAWHEKNANHWRHTKGRKRPDQSLVMKQMFADGRLKRTRTPEQLVAMGVRSKNWIAKNGHPKGALGMKHTDATKQRMSEASIKFHNSRTEDQTAERVLKMMKTKSERGNMVTPRPNATWKSGWREIGGVRKYYRSRWEANYARYLEWLKGMGQILSWAHEPKTFWFEGIKRGCVSYLPDFCVVEIGGQEGYHEVKGWFDDRSKTKIARMAKYHPEVKLIVIDGKQYKALEKSVSKFISDWEFSKTSS